DPTHGGTGARSIRPRAVARVPRRCGARPRVRPRAGGAEDPSRARGRPLRAHALGTAAGRADLRSLSPARPRSGDRRLPPARARRTGHARQFVLRTDCPRRGPLDRSRQHLPARAVQPAEEVMQPFQRIAAVFDIDDSLLDGNAGTIFTWFLYSNREMMSAVRSQVPRALYEYARKRLSEADMVALGSRCQQGIRADRLRDLARKCFDRHLKKRVTQQGLRTVRRHLLMGHLILVASGSPQFIIDELGMV